MSEWYEDHDNIVTMARRMAEQDATASNVVAFIDKPWKWTRQWEDLDEHDDEWCNGILECERKECSSCHDREPECQIHTIFYEYARDEFDEFDACPACRIEKPWTQPPSQCADERF